MNSFKYGFTSTGRDYNGKIELVFTDGPYQGVEFILDGMRFAEQENEDGSINMSFDYEVTNDREVDENFGSTLGDLLYHVLEEQVKKQAVISKGGTGETQVVSE